MAKQLQGVILRFERDRAAFTWALADAARHEGNAAPLAAMNAPALLLPLLDDPCPNVAHTAAFALGRLAGHSRSVATLLAQKGAVSTLINRITEEGSAIEEDAGGVDRRYAAKRAAMGMLVSLTRHSAQLSCIVVAQGGLQAAITCLGETDAEVREGAAWTLAHLVAHSQELAAASCAAGALPPLIACLAAPAAAVQGSDAALKRVAASALGDICGHSAELAGQAVAAGALGTIAALLRAPLSNDARLKRQLLCALMNMAKDASLAQAVADAGLVPDVARCLKFADDTVRRHAAACLRETVRHSQALAAAVVQAPGALDALAAYAAAASPPQALPALLTFGFVCDQSLDLAAKVAATPGVLPALVTALECTDEPSQAAAAWTLGRLGGHSSALAAQAAAVLPRLCALAVSAPEGSDLQTKCLRAAGAIVGQATDVAQLAAWVVHPGLEPLLDQLLQRCAHVMAKQPASRAVFATSGALAHLDARKAALSPSSITAQHIAACLHLFPEELLRHYSAAYAAKLLASLGTDPPPTDAIPASRPATAQAQPVEAEAAPAADEAAAAAVAATNQMEGEEAPAEDITAEDVQSMGHNAAAAEGEPTSEAAATPYEREAAPEETQTAEEPTAEKGEMGEQAKALASDEENVLPVSAEAVAGGELGTESGEQAAADTTAEEEAAQGQTEQAALAGVEAAEAEPPAAQEGKHEQDVAKAETEAATTPLES